MILLNIRLQKKNSWVYYRRHGRTQTKVVFGKPISEVDEVPLVYNKITANMSLGS